MKERTQILLESRQGAVLRREAKARKCSVSAVLRQLIDEHPCFSRSVGDDPFSALAGAVDGSRDPVGRNAETFLYGETL